ncbi:MAG: nuclear transport factor 2 family protein [Alphaproteobacteria bacterium]|nr:nuclear transport factor 2 family protein [Alphaproteobacteria bacterium]
MGDKNMHIDLPPTIQNFLTAVNERDIDAAMATFTADALVNDKHRFFLGVDAIREWSEAEFTGIGVTVEVTDKIEHYGDTILTTKLGGGFDKALFDTFTVNNSIVALNGPMPDAIHAMYFMLDGDLITQLVITAVDGSSPIRAEAEAFYVARPGA